MTFWQKLAIVVLMTIGANLFIVVLRRFGIEGFVVWSALIILYILLWDFFAKGR